MTLQALREREVPLSPSFPHYAYTSVSQEKQERSIYRGKKEI